MSGTCEEALHRGQLRHPCHALRLEVFCRFGRGEEEESSGREEVTSRREVGRLTQRC
jgi:hypothetical protein